MESLIGYLERKGRYIANSGVRKKAGLRNSSNGVEGLNMVNTAIRQKLPSMSWRENGSGSLSAISTLFINDQAVDWFFNHHISFSLVKVKGQICPEDVETEENDMDIESVLPDSAEMSIYLESDSE